MIKCLIDCCGRYPDELAWQVDLSRKAVRSEDILNKFHRFLVCETEIVSDMVFYLFVNAYMFIIVCVWCMH